jgi:hypothetical protein
LKEKADKAKQLEEAGLSVPEDLTKAAQKLQAGLESKARRQAEYRMRTKAAHKIKGTTPRCSGDNSVEVKSYSNLVFSF